MPPRMRSRAASMSAIASMSEGQCNAGFRGGQYAAEFALDALERRRVVRLEAQHDHRRRVRRARETEAVRIFDAQTVDANHIGGPREVGGRLELRDQRML